MKNSVICTAGMSPALDYAGSFITAAGYTVTDTPSQQVTHLLLPVPTFEAPGIIKGGIPLESLLQTLPEDVIICGGNLDTTLCSTYRCVDFLQDESYLAQNARITAHCALKLAAWQFPGIIMEQPVLVVGWGRIGKHLAKLLRAMDANVTVAARKESDRGMLQSLGYRTITPQEIVTTGPYRLLFNTVPQPLAENPKGCLAIDLASVKGISGDSVIWARGLPGKDAPEASGKQIADAVLRFIQEQEESS